LASSYLFLLDEILLGRGRLWLVLDVLALGYVAIGCILVELTGAVGTLDEAFRLRGHLVSQLTDF
jgi:hypothetical protein